MKQFVKDFGLMLVLVIMTLVVIYGSIGIIYLIPWLVTNYLFYILVLIFVIYIVVKV